MMRIFFFLSLWNQIPEKSVGFSPCNTNKAKFLLPNPISYLLCQFCCQLLHNIVKLCIRNSTPVSWVMVQCHYLVFLVTQLQFHHALLIYIYLHVQEGDFSNQACIKSLNVQSEKTSELLELSDTARYFFLYQDFEKSKWTIWTNTSFLDSMISVVYLFQFNSANSEFFILTYFIILTYFLSFLDNSFLSFF